MPKKLSGSREGGLGAGMQGGVSGPVVCLYRTYRSLRIPKNRDGDSHACNWRWLHLVRVVRSQRKHGHECCVCTVREEFHASAPSQPLMYPHKRICRLSSIYKLSVHLLRVGCTVCGNCSCTPLVRKGFPMVVGACGYGCSTVIGWTRLEANPVPPGCVSGVLP